MTRFGDEKREELAYSTEHYIIQQHGWTKIYYLSTSHKKRDDDIDEYASGPFVTHVEIGDPYMTIGCYQAINIFTTS